MDRVKSPSSSLRRPVRVPVEVEKGGDMASCRAVRGHGLLIASKIVGKIGNLKLVLVRSASEEFS